MSDHLIRKAHFAPLNPTERLGDAPVEAEYHHKMTAICRFIDEHFNGPAHGQRPQVGFVLMVFPYGDKTGRCNYMSNGANRRDVVTLMREMIARFSGQPEMKGEA